jgi:hypothetical protein
LDAHHEAPSARQGERQRITTPGGEGCAIEETQAFALSPALNDKNVNQFVLAAVMC